MIEDRQTAEYFDQFTPHFSQAKFQFALDWLAANASSEASLVDIGCGDGGTIALIKEHTPIRTFAGFDVAKSYVDKAAAATGCEAIHGSILDTRLVQLHACRFDYAVMGAVLHHLIGNTRAACHASATTCVEHALALLRPGGHLLIFEPTFRPRAAMWGAFWIKKILGSVIKSRVEIGGLKWLNIAQPVVSYYTDDQVDQMLMPHHVEAIESHTVDRIRLGLVLERHGVGLVVRKPTAADH